MQDTLASILLDGPLCYITIILDIFQTIIFLLYSMCHYLEGIKDALSECSGLVSQNSGAVCKNMEAVEIEIHSRARGEKRLSAACWQARLPSFSRSKRYGSCSLSYHTCFKSLVASTFVRDSSENVAFIGIYFAFKQMPNAAEQRC